MVRGNMVGGFALVAYPAEYRNSGLTTFIVNDQGSIYEKDLGSRTAAIASAMTSFDPDRHLAAGDPSGSVPSGRR